MKQQAYIQRELELSVKNLDADNADIEHLMTYVSATGASLPQIPGLLSQAYGRLIQLRSITQKGEDAVEGNKDLTKIMQRALLASTQLEYQQAADCYMQAANEVGSGGQSQWHYYMQSAQMLLELGREFSDNNALQQTIYLIEDDVMPLVQGENKTQEYSASLQLLGSVRAILGQRQGGTKNLEYSIEAFEASLSKRDRMTHPLQWAETQNSLGNSLGALAHRQNDLEMLSQSVTAFEQALEERTRDAVPNDWASTTNNLAAMLQATGQRNKNSKLIKRAVDAYKEIMLVWTRETVPQQWATTADNLGTALRLLGEQRKGPRTLEQSVAAYKSALTERTRECFSQEWAMTQNNLGAALHKLAEREDNSANIMTEAIEAYENTLQEWTREAYPMAWAMTMANLGVARRGLAEAKGSVEIARQSLEELETVSDVFRQLSHAHYSELSIDQIAKAQKVIKALSK